jgi:hypothetical protein
VSLSIVQMELLDLLRFRQHLKKVLGRPLCLLYPIETAKMIYPSESGHVKDQEDHMTPKKVLKAANVAKQRIKDCLYEK